MVNILNPKPYSPSDAKIAEMVRRIVREFDPVKIILFGSCARGDATDASDVDLLVVLDRIDDHHETTGRILDSLKGAGAPVDVLISTPEDVEARRGRVGDMIAWALDGSEILYEKP